MIKIRFFLAFFINKECEKKRKKRESAFASVQKKSEISRESL